MKISTFRIYRGGGGSVKVAPQKQKIVLKNQSKWRFFLTFLFFFLLFGKAPYIPKIMNLFPSSP